MRAWMWKEIEQSNKKSSIDGTDAGLYIKIYANVYEKLLDFYDVLGLFIFCRKQFVFYAFISESHRCSARLSYTY
jgi:hypothetical protein